MTERPGVMLYFDILPALEKMEASDAGRLFVAVLRYAQGGTEPELDGSADLVWSFIKSSIDRDGRRYRHKQLQAQWKVYCREERKFGREPLPFDSWISQEKLSTDNISYQQMTDDSFDGACYPPPSLSPSPPASPPLSPTPPPSSLRRVEGAAGPHTDEEIERMRTDEFEQKRREAIGKLRGTV